MWKPGCAELLKPVLWRWCGGFWKGALDRYKAWSVQSLIGTKPGRPRIPDAAPGPPALWSPCPRPRSDRNDSLTRARAPRPAPRKIHEALPDSHKPMAAPLAPTMACPHVDCKQVVVFGVQNYKDHLDLHVKWSLPALDPLDPNSPHSPAVNLVPVVREYAALIKELTQERIQVRQLRHHFGPFLAHFSARYYPAHGMGYALLRAMLNRVLIGAWNPML